MAKLFVSYSRRDSTAARKLIEAFKSIEQEVWVDWEAIPPAVDWLEQIFRGIEEADAFIFMISPDSIASEVCKVEIARAVLNSKRIIPIVLRDVDPKTTPDDIRKLNWTFLRETDNFEEGLAKVKTAIELDLDWLEEHRRLQVRALEWHRKKDTSLLLHGRDLRNALHMVQTYTSKDPNPTELQLKYIEYSRRTERTRTIMWIITGVTLMVMTVLTYLAVTSSQAAVANASAANTSEANALIEKGRADGNAATAESNRLTAVANEQEAIRQEGLAKESEKFAEAQRSAARAQIYQTRTGELYTSTLLAIDSLKKSPTDEAEEIIRRNISLLPIPVAQAYQGGSIEILEMNPSGGTFLSASTDGSLYMWSVKDGEELWRYQSSSPVTDAIFLRKGASIAYADQSGLVKVLNSATGEVERDLDSELDAESNVRDLNVRDLDVTSDGEILAVALEDGNIIIIQGDEPIDQADKLFLSGGRLAVVDFSPDGLWLAAGSQTGRVAIWKLDGTQEPFGYLPHRAEILSLHFSPNSRFVITGGADNYAVGFDIRINDMTFRLPHSDWVTDIQFPFEEWEWFVTASDDSTARIWELSTARERLILSQDGAVADITLSSSKKWIASTGEDKTVRVWSVDSGVEMVQVPLKANGTAVAFSADDQLLVSSDEAGNLGIWDVSEMTAPLGYTPFDKLAWTSKFTPAGDRLIASDANRVWVLNPGNISGLGTRPQANSARVFEDDINNLVVSPDSQTIGLSTVGGEYFIQNLQTRNLVRVEPAGVASGLAFSTDNSLFITAATNGFLETWDVKTGEQIKAVELDNPIFSLAASPAGIAVGLTDRVLLLDLGTGQMITELPAPGENHFLASSVDGSMLASVNSSGLIQIWKAENGNFEPLKPVQKGPVYSMAFTPQGNLLAVAAVDNVYIIDAISSQEVSRIPHRGIVYDVSFSSDGTRLATASQKMIQQWGVSEYQKSETGDLIELACSRLIQNFSAAQWSAMFGSGEKFEKLCDNLPVPQ
jgi:WD40 repeat protein